MGNNNVNLIMLDELTGKEIHRSIDITNAMDNGAECWELNGHESQRENLERWIEERGNDQHNTILKLQDWSFS